MQLSLSSAFEKFLNYRRTYCEDKTIRNYSNTLRYFTDFMENHRQCSASEIMVDSITSDDISSYVCYLRDKKKNDNHPLTVTSENTITKRTVRTYSTDMRTFFNWLLQEEYIQPEKSPIKNFKLIKSEVKAILPITADELNIIVDGYSASTETGIRNLCIIHLFIDEGLRLNEVCKLKLSDISFLNNCIVINGKGNKQRIVPMARKVRKYLERYINIYRPDVSHEYVLCNINDSPLTGDSIKSLFNRIVKRTGITRLYPHLLRHTFATSFILGGGSVEMLRIYMGHSDINTTQNYMHVVNSIQFSQNVYRLDDIFFRRYFV